MTRCCSEQLQQSWQTAKRPAQKSGRTRSSAAAGRPPYRQARDIIVRLKSQSPYNATLPKDLAFYEARLAELAK